MSRPSIQEIPSYHVQYVEKVKGDNLVQAMNNSLKDFIDLCESIPSEKEDYRYAEGKWSIKEVIQHIIDCERIFNYRALCIARGEQIDLPGFEENEYNEVANVERRTLVDLKSEMINLRNSTMSLFSSFTEEDLARKGRANGLELGVNVIGFVNAGHMIHHLMVIKERYL